MCIRDRFKAAQAAEREAGKSVISLRDNINRITRQMSDWETPKRSKQMLVEFLDPAANNISPSKRSVPFTPLQNQTKDVPSYGILAQPLSRPSSPWEKRNIGTGDLASPKTPALNNKRSISSLETKQGNSGTPEKIHKIVGVDDHGFLNFPTATSTKSYVNESHRLPDSQLILPNDTDELFKDIKF